VLWTWLRALQALFTVFRFDASLWQGDASAGLRVGQFALARESLDITTLFGCTSQAVRSVGYNSAVTGNHTMSMGFPLIGYFLTFVFRPVEHSWPPFGNSRAHLLRLAGTRNLTGVESCRANASNPRFPRHILECWILGSSPRVWCYFLRDGDPSRRRFAASSSRLGQDADEDPILAEQRRLTDTTDLSIVVGRLHLTDCIGFSRSMMNDKDRAGALAGATFKRCCRISENAAA